MRALRDWHFVVGLILTLTLLWPLFAAPYFRHHDNVQTMRIFEMRQCISDWQIPCRWVPDAGGGYGYPLFNYYAPLPYYVGQFFYQLTQDLLVAAKLTFAAPLVLSYISMYVFATSLWGRLGGSLSAIFYSFAPYHAHNMYIRGAMGELWAMAALPLVMWAFFRLRTHPTALNCLLLGLAGALLIVSHNLSAMLLLTLVAGWGLLQFWSNKQFSYARHLLLGGFWAVGLSAFYLVPMLLEIGLVHLDTTMTGDTVYTMHFQDLRTLFFKNLWWYGSASLDPTTPSSFHVTYQIGPVHVVAWGLSLFGAYLAWRKTRQLPSIIPVLSAIIAACIYMIHPRSEWIWNAVGPLQYLQFPWRFLILITLATSTLAGAVVLLVAGSRRRSIVWVALVVLVTVANVGWFRPEVFLNETQTDLLSGPGWDNLRMYAIWDFLPRSAEVVPDQPAAAAYELKSGDGQLADLRSGSNWLRFSAAIASDSVIQINRFDFPTWEITVDGRPIDYRRDSTTGVIQLSVAPGVHTIEARLRDTLVRTLSNITTAIATIGALTLCAVVGLRSALVRRRRVLLVDALRTGANA